LSEENKKLKEKCSGLEELLSEEETNIGDVLSLIQSMQTSSTIGHIPPLSAVAAKLRRDFK
jgi:hypothetical protein